MVPAKAAAKRARTLERDRKRTIRKVAVMDRLDCSRTYVRHPRYGGTPLRSNDQAAQDAARKHFRGVHPCGVPNEVSTGHGLFYPESALRVRAANLVAREYAPILCMDQGQRCRTCGKWFLFWALEQKHWLEVLGLRGTQCFDCSKCRSDRHYKERLALEYEELLAAANKTPDQWDRFAALGDRLFEIGYITKRETLNKTRMPKRLRRIL
ncbi:MAG: zinc-ribbon domain containing protein [Paracoccaceae bacterium]